ncbi:MAG: hypothetical protein ACLFS5_03080 [Spirochaetaceae bacterium]
MTDSSAFRKTLLTLPDESFFELVRNYLGEVRTPFNKQSLVDRLIGFLGRPVTQGAIIAALDEDDRRFLSAAMLLEGPSREELFGFLSAEYTRLEIENRLLNLQDRLLLFPEPETDRLRLNPILSDALAEAGIGAEALFPRYSSTATSEAEPRLTDLALAALFSLLLEAPVVLRANGALAKRSRVRLARAIPSLFTGGGSAGDGSQARTGGGDDGGGDGGRLFAALRRALRDLGLTEESDSEIRPVVAAFRDFARLSRSGRLALLWSAAAGLGATGACTVRTVLRALADGTAMRESHVLQLSRLAAGRCGGAPLTEDALDTLCVAGVLTETAETLYTATAGTVGLSAPEATTDSRAGKGRNRADNRTGRPGVVTPSYQLTLTPHAPLELSLPAVAASRLVRYDRYCEFELTREAVLGAFGHGFRAEEVTESLEKLHDGELPQNVRFSIRTWREEYERVELLDGVVLLVDESHAPMLEHSPELAPYLHRRLGPGAFLLSRAEENRWRRALESAGLGAVPAIKSVGPPETLPLSPRRYSEPPALDPDLYTSFGAAPAAAAAEDNTAAPGAKATAPVPTGEAATESAGRLHEAAQAAELTDEQRAEVERRIERKLIVVPEQITAAVIPRELPEARGVDYAGKVRIIEQALGRATDHLEVVDRGAGGPQRLLLRPLRLQRDERTLVLHGETVGERRPVALRVDKLGLVRAIRGALFAR